MDILQDADLKGEKLTILYQTKDGIMLPPKDISPPFEFVKDKEGKTDAIVKAWDEQKASWKSFIIDNIIDLELKNKENQNVAG
jgi:predicted DNA-binding transcriptional regulator YafY